MKLGREVQLEIQDWRSGTQDVLFEGSRRLEIFQGERTFSDYFNAGRMDDWFQRQTSNRALVWTLVSGLIQRRI